MNNLDMKNNSNIETVVKFLKLKFPNAFDDETDDNLINFDILKSELAGHIRNNIKEKYELLWPGKKNIIFSSEQSTTNTLLPQTDKSVQYDETKNVYIEGDNFEVLKILQESYLEKVKCIYIDPPYNTGNDFIYKDNFGKDRISELIDSGQIDDVGNRLVSNNTSNGRFHSDWLSMMYPRLKLARNLLTKDGMIFISIDENEYVNLKKICDEIFGEACYIATFVWQKRTGGGFSNSILSINHEYILLYSKSSAIKLIDIVKDDQDVKKIYNFQDDKSLYKRRDLRKSGTADRRVDRPTLYYEIIAPDGSKIVPKKANGEDGRWTYSKETFLREKDSNNIDFVKQNDNTWKVYYKERYYEDKDRTQKHETLLTNLVSNTQGSKEIEILFGDKNYFSFPKPTKLLKYLIKMATSQNDIVLDFFAGSSSTADAVMQLNAEDNFKRQFILVQIPELLSEDSEGYKNGYKTICDIGQERIRRAGKKIKEETNADIDYGFRVYKVDSSNMKDVFYKPSDITQLNILDMASNIKEDRTAEDLLTQVMLDLGLTLDLKIEEKNIMNNNVYFVENNALIACFDDNINIDIIDEICKYNPLKVVFKDISFKSDKDKINLEERVKKLSPETEISIL